MSSSTYYLRNRYYNPSNGRFTSEDPIRDGLNWYTYCGNNPVLFIDPWGLERIVLSAGAYNNKTNKTYQFEFIDSSLKQIELWIGGGSNPAEITLLVTNLGWSSQNITDIEYAAKSYGVNISWINDVSDITSYINTGGQDARQTDKITHFSVFSHGLKDDGGIIALSYGHETSKNLYWGKGDLEVLNSCAFNSAESWFYSCRTGYHKGDSFGKAWADITNGATYAAYGLNGKTEYKNINGSNVSKILSNKRATWKEQRGSYGKPGQVHHINCLDWLFLPVGYTLDLTDSINLMTKFLV